MRYTDLENSRLFTKLNRSCKKLIVNVTQKSISLWNIDLTVQWSNGRSKLHNSHRSRSIAISLTVYVLCFVRLTHLDFAISGRAIRGLRNHGGCFHHQRLILRGYFGSSRSHLHLKSRQTIVELFGRRRVSEKWTVTAKKWQVHWTPVNR